MEDIRELTLKSHAPALIHEEGDLVRRAIRDLYSRDVEEILVEGEAGYQVARNFMRMIVPSHVNKVVPYRDPSVPLMQRYQVEAQLDAIHSPTVQLRSGGYIVINPTEALVAIDVNSGRATKERHIEETALKTNIEAADEVARQIRLRDLAGLVVIDFIDMVESRNIHAVERRLREAMKNDRARIQIGRISSFGLMELSRQRLRSSLLESSSTPCPHCGGTGHLRSTESSTLHILRALEEEGMGGRTAGLKLEVPTDIAMFIMNQKRAAINDIETRYGLKIEFARDDSLIPPNFRITNRVIRAAGEFIPPPRHPTAAELAYEESFDNSVEIADEEPEESESFLSESTRETAPESEAESHPESNRKSNGRNRQRGRNPWRRNPAPTSEGVENSALSQAEAGSAGGESEVQAPKAVPEAGAADSDNGDGHSPRRKRGRRGGRRRQRRSGEGQDRAGPEQVNQNPDSHGSDSVDDGAVRDSLSGQNNQNADLTSGAELRHDSSDSVSQKSGGYGLAPESDSESELSRPEAEDAGEKWVPRRRSKYGFPNRTPGRGGKPAAENQASSTPTEAYSQPVPERIDTKSSEQSAAPKADEPVTEFEPTPQKRKKGGWWGIRRGG